MQVGIALIPAGRAAKVNASQNNLYKFLEIQISLLYDIM